MVMVDLRPEAQIMPNLRMRKEKWPQTAVNAFRLPKLPSLTDYCRLLQEIGVAECNGVVIIVARTRPRSSQIAVSAHAP